MKSCVWYFGDGKVFAGPVITTHSYKRAGTYTVRAVDLDGKSIVPITTVVVVGQLNPRSPSRPGSPGRGRPSSSLRLILFRRLSSAGISAMAPSSTTPPPTISHVYNLPGHTRSGLMTTAAPRSRHPFRLLSIRRQRSSFPPPILGPDSLSPSTPSISSRRPHPLGFRDGTVENDPTPPSIIHSIPIRGRTR